MNILVFDVGNTNISVGFYGNERLMNTFTLKSDKDCSAGEYYRLISGKLGSVNIDFICASSVVPVITKTFEEMISKYFTAEHIFITSSTPLGLKYPIPNPSHIGADIIVAAYAAITLYKANCIIIDCGTATTIEFVGADGQFYGYVILPGLGTAVDSLFAKAAQLSPFELYNPSSLLGIYTNEAIACGVVNGHIFTIERYIEAIKQEYSGLGEIKTVLTGGGSFLIENDIQGVDVVNKTLLLEGLVVSCKLAVGGW